MVTIVQSRFAQNVVHVPGRKYHRRRRRGYNGVDSGADRVHGVASNLELAKFLCGSIAHDFVRDWER